MVDRSRLESSVPVSRMRTGLGRARAMSALAQVGLSADGLERADSVTNEVWLTADYAVRVNRDASLRLYRESVLSMALPRDVGYPIMVQHGGEVGSDWLILERVPGKPLSRWWPTMTEAQRRSAVHQLAQRMRTIHAIRCPRLDGLVEVPQLLDRATTGRDAVARLLDALRRLESSPFVDAGVLRDTAQHIRDHAGALDPFDAGTIVHGDLTFENVLWDGEQITAMLDFEFARPGPPDLDLDVLLRFCALPQLHVAADYEAVTKASDYAEVPWWLGEDYPELFAHPRQFERARIYSLAWDVHELLTFPPMEPARDLHRHHPYRRLMNVLRGTSYLDRLNGSDPFDF